MLYSTVCPKLHFPPCQLPPPPSVSADISWINYLLTLMPNKISLTSDKPININWWGDASSSFRVGIIIGSHWAAWRWGPGVKVGPKQQFDIAWAEAVAVELGLQLALQLSMLTNVANRPVLIHSHNASIVAVTNRGQACNQEANRILKHIYTLLAENQTWVVAEYVASADNIADPLSRGNIKGFLSRVPGAKSKAKVTLPIHLANLLQLWQ